MVRDSALLPGPTAAQWDIRARARSSAGLWWGWPTSYCSRLGRRCIHRPRRARVLALAGFIVWLVLGALSQRRQRAEMREGYSTMVDAAGYDLRHPVTGALERDRAEPPEPRRAAARS